MNFFSHLLCVFAAGKNSSDTVWLVEIDSEHTALQDVPDDYGISLKSKRNKEQTMVSKMTKTTYF